MSTCFSIIPCITSIHDERGSSKKTECNATDEIPPTYFPIILADLDSNGIENILIVRLHGHTSSTCVCIALRSSNLFSLLK